MRCPGLDPRFLKVETRKCNRCGYQVEIFSDEVKVRCPKCRNPVYREIPSCIGWCRYARQCIGEEKWKQMQSGKG